MLNKKRNSFKKRRAIYLLVSCQLDEDTVARDLSISKATIRKWMKEPVFAADLEKAMQRIEGIDSKWRAKQNKVVVGRLYDELHERIANTRELRDMSLPVLLSKIKEINNEIRVDTPGDVTSRGEVQHKHELIMEDLVKRYNEFTKKEGKPNLSLVEMPDDKEEAANE